MEILITNMNHHLHHLKTNLRKKNDRKTESASKDKCNASVVF